MEDRISLKNKEESFLKEKYKENPNLFTWKTSLEDNAYLSKIGMSLPNKQDFPKGYIKYWPFDFIVEEIDENGLIHTISKGTSTSDFANTTKDQTIFATLVKCNISTLQAIEEIAKALGCDKTQIQYAGIKDTNAITAQRISIRGINLSKIKDISSPYFFLKDTVVGKGAMSKGGLKGNRFTILIRTDNEIYKEKIALRLRDSLHDIKTNGFYNFFYTQRFAIPRLENYHWGMGILRGEYRKVIYDYLTQTNENELPFFAHLRNDLREHFGDWDYIHNKIESLPLLFSSELLVIKHLQQRPDDYIGALAKIPEQVQLWLYAVSSFLFNCVLSDMAKSNLKSPEKLPLVLSNNESDWQPYITLLKHYGLHPLKFANAQKIQHLLLKERLVPTIEKVAIHEIDVIPEGIIIQFTLGKGDYATSFLSHLFNLTNGKPFEGIKGGVVDIGEKLHQLPLKDSIDHFRDVARGKHENPFEIKIEKDK